jgi:hypothetical protein
MIPIIVMLVILPIFSITLLVLLCVIGYKSIMDLRRQGRKNVSVILMCVTALLIGMYATMSFRAFVDLWYIFT